MAALHKIYVSSEEAGNKAVLTGRIVAEAGFNPDSTIAIYGGGAAIAPYVSGALEHYKISHQGFTAKGKSYGKGLANQLPRTKIYNMEEIMMSLRDITAKKVLLIDDVFDTGRTYHAFHHIITNGLKKTDVVNVEDGNNGATKKYVFRLKAKVSEYDLVVPLHDDIQPLDVEVKIATPYWKPYANITDKTPDFYVKPVNLQDGNPVWIVFPWEAASDIEDKDELKDHFPLTYEILYKS